MTKEKLLLIINDKKKKNFFIYGIGQAFNLLSPLIVAPYVISICKEQGLGKVGMGFALAMFLILIVEYAFDIKGTKQAAESRDSKEALEHLLNITIFTKLFLFIIAFFIGLLFILLIPFFYQEKTLFFFSLAIVLAQALNPAWFLQGIENFVWVTAINISSKIFYLLLVFCFISFKQDYIYVNLFLGLSALVCNVAGLFLIKFKYNYKIIFPKTPEVVGILKRDFSFSVSQLFLSVRELSPLILTGYFLGYFYAGQYKIIENIITLIRTFLLVFLKFFYPSLCYKILTDLKEGFAFWKKYTLLCFSMVLTGVSFAIVYAPEILTFFNAQPASVASLTFVFRSSLAISLLMAVNLPLEQLMVALNKNKIYIKIVIFVTVANLLLLVYAIKNYALIGIVVALIISEMIFAVLYFKNAFLDVQNRTTQIVK